MKTAEEIVKCLESYKFGVEVEMDHPLEDVAETATEVLDGKCAPAEPKTTFPERKRRFNITLPDSRIYGVDRDLSIASSRGDNYCSELVTPIITQPDLVGFEKTLAQIKSEGGIANVDCSVHVTVDASGFDNHEDGLKNPLVRLLVEYHKNQDIFNRMLLNPNYKFFYTKYLEPEVVKKVVAAKSPLERFEAWYTNVDLKKHQLDLAKQYNYGDLEDVSNYINHTRWRALNLHGYFHKGRIEFRAAGTPPDLDVDKIRAVTDLWRGLTVASLHNVKIPELNTGNPQKMENYLTSIGLIGHEFQTSREILCEKYAKCFEPKKSGLKKPGQQITSSVVRQ